MGNNLLIDIGNSNIKIALSKNESDIYKKGVYKYDRSKFGTEFAKILKEYTSEKIKPGTLERTGISVTNPAFHKILKEKSKNSEILFISNKTSPFVKITYKSKLGNDRVCEINAAYHLYKKEHILLVDFGTATTLNMIRKGEFIGGAISPGIQTGLNSLSVSTPLPKSPIKFRKDIIFDNTNDSISNGTTHQTVFYIERAVSELKKKYSKLYVIATGGLSELVSHHTDCIDIVDRDLVLKGINLILNSRT